jgi:hypothetical protein
MAGAARRLAGCRQRWPTSCAFSSSFHTPSAVSLSSLAPSWLVAMRARLWRGASRVKLIRDDTNDLLNLADSLPVMEACMVMAASAMARMGSAIDSISS